MDISKAAPYRAFFLRLFHAHAFKNFLGRKALQKPRKPFRWGIPPDPQKHEREASPKFFAFSNFYAILILPSMTRLHDYP